MILRFRSRIERRSPDIWLSSEEKERVSEEELEEEAVPEVKDGVEEVVSDLVSAAGEEDKSEKTPIKPEQIKR